MQYEGWRRGILEAIQALQWIDTFVVVQKNNETQRNHDACTVTAADGKKYISDWSDIKPVLLVIVEVQ